MCRALTLTGAVVIALWGGEALATGPLCSDLPAPIYVAGTAAAGPLVQALSVPLLADASAATLVYQPLSSCAAVEAVALDTSQVSCGQGACLYGSATFYTLDGTLKTCDLAPAGTHAHVALGDVAAGTCPVFGGNTPPGIVDVPGPVVPHAFIAPTGLPEQSIQAPEAHFVFGFGQVAGVAPWTDNATIVSRDERDGGQILLGLHIQVPPGRFKGTSAASTDAAIAALLAGDPSTGIAFAPTPVTDLRRSDFKVLAFQALGQRGAFFPDARSTTFDKQNVRDGHYALWGYLHMIALSDPQMPTQPAAPQAQRLIGLVLGPGGTDVPDPELLQAQSGMVPLCAMKVARSADTAPLAPYVSTTPCGCWFAKTVPMGSTSCTACTDDTACSGGKCRRGYCEAR